MLTGILVFFHVMACLTLILVILLQVGRGHGLSGASFAQSGVQTVFGTRTVDFLSKATTVMAIVFVITCITLDIIQARRSRSLFAPGGGGASKVDLEKIREALAKLQQEEAQKKSGQGTTETSVPAPSPAPSGEAKKDEVAASRAASSPQAVSVPAAAEPVTESPSSSKSADAAPKPLPAEAPSKGG